MKVAQQFIAGAGRKDRTVPSGTIECLQPGIGRIVLYLSCRDRLPFLTITAFCVLIAVTGCSRKPEPCRTAIRSQERSPNGQFKAVVYLRKCPDEVLFTTNVSILPIDQPVPDDTGNTVVCPDALAVRVRWQGNNQLTVLSFSDLSKATKQKRVGNVSIDYPEVTNPDLFQPPPSEEPASSPPPTP
jgi:hypothetical protein